MHPFHNLDQRYRQPGLGRNDSNQYSEETDLFYVLDFLVTILLI